MKKSRRSSKPKSRKSQTPKVAAPETNRRALLRSLGLGAVVLTGAGWWGAREVAATMAEHDLSRIGQGIPAIVQVHDPNCPTCRALQREVRAALRDTSDDQVIYLVANIKSDEGAALARQYAVPHVTLLLFDATGALQETLRGPNSRDILRGHFAAHALPVTG